MPPQRDARAAKRLAKPPGSISGRVGTYDPRQFVLNRLTMIVALQQICILLIQLQIVNRRPEARGYWTYAKSITAECRRTKENPRATRSALVPNRRKPDATKLLGGAALAEASAAPTAQDHQPRSGGTRTRRERPCGRGVQRRLQTGRCSRGRRGRCRSSRRSSRRRRLFGSRLLRSGSLLRSR